MMLKSNSQWKSLLWDTSHQLHDKMLNKNKFTNLQICPLQENGAVLRPCRVHYYYKLLWDLDRLPWIQVRRKDIYILCRKFIDLDSGEQGKTLVAV